MKLKDKYTQLLPGSTDKKSLSFEFCNTSLEKLASFDTDDIGNKNLLLLGKNPCTKLKTPKICENNKKHKQKTAKIKGDVDDDMCVDDVAVDETEEIDDFGDD